MITIEWQVRWKPEELKRVFEIIDKNMLLLAELTVAYAKRYSPYLTGHNRSSITLDLYKDGQAVKTWSDGKFSKSEEGFMTAGKGWAFRIYTQSGYGAYLELGTAQMTARPYIYRGFMDALDTMLKRLERVA